MKLSWKDVFNAHHGQWGHITVGAQAAHRAGYRYMSWNGRLYEVSLDERRLQHVPVVVDGEHVDESFLS